MTILHVTDFRFNKRWFHWLLHHAPAHDLVVMSGDMLDRWSATPQRQQIEWVSNWLNDFPRPLCVCSGDHDLEWNFAFQRWMPAYWLRRIDNPNVWTDGQRVELDGLSLLNISGTTRPKGEDADVWVVHAPPSGTSVAQRVKGADAGDPDLVAAISRHSPRLVLSGHVHDAISWRDNRNGTLLLNPGFTPGAPFPNHILVQTDRLSSELITAAQASEPASADPGVPAHTALTPATT